VKLRVSLLAREAKSNVDGTFDIIGGGVTEFKVAGGYLLGAPMKLDFAAVIRVEMDDKELDTLRSAELTVMFEGQRIGWPQRLPLAMRRVEGEKRYYVNLITELHVLVPKTGEGYIQVVLDEGRVSAPHMHFRVSF